MFCTKISLQVTLPLDTTVVGDVVISVYHVRQQLGRIHTVPILSVSFHCGFLAYDQHAIKFARYVNYSVVTVLTFSTINNFQSWTRYAWHLILSYKLCSSWDPEFEIVFFRNVFTILKNTILNIDLRRTRAVHMYCVKLVCDVLKKTSTNNCSHEAHVKCARCALAAHSSDLYAPLCIKLDVLLTLYYEMLPRYL